MYGDHTVLLIYQVTKLQIAPGHECEAGMGERHVAAVQSPSWLARSRAT